MSENTENVAVPIKNSNNQKVLIKLAAIFVFGLTAIASLFLLAATALGKDSALSGLAAVLPVEKIPFLSSLRKSDQTLVSDALVSQFDADMVKKLGGREQKADLKLVLEAEQSDTQPAFTLNADITSNTSLAKNGESAKVTSKINFNLSAGVFSFDTGDGGIDAEMLIPNKNEMYLKFVVSQKIKDTLDLIFKSQVNRAGAPNFDIDKYLDKYIYLNVTELQKYQTAQRQQNPLAPAVDQEKVQKALEELINEIRPDLLQFGKNITLKVAKDAQIKALAREKVGSQTAMVFEIDVDENKMPDIAVSAIEDLMAFVKAHRSSFEKFCEATNPPSGMYDKDCKQQFDEMEEGFAKFDSTEKNKAREAMEKFFRIFQINGFKLYISPVDNTLIKTEAVIEFNVSELQSSMGKNGPKLKKFTISYNVEEVSRGKDFTVEAPADSLNWVEEMMKSLAPMNPSPAPLGSPFDLPSTRTTLPRPQL